MKIIKSFRPVILALALAAGAFAQKQAPPPPSPAGTAPAMVIDSLTHDFGEVKSGTPLKYAFIVKNKGTADLLISNVAPG